MCCCHTSGEAALDESGKKGLAQGNKRLSVPMPGPLPHMLQLLRTCSVSSILAEHSSGTLKVIGSTPVLEELKVLLKKLEPHTD